MNDGMLFNTSPMESGAEFSPCRTWRYVLWRQWEFGADARFMACCGLNPSTADETADDNTIRRVIRFAKDWGFSGVYMLNAYGFRATDPRDMKAADDPNGPGNDESLARIAGEVELIVAAWGVHCEPERERAVLSLFNRPVHCLGRTKAGRPKHPLYIPAKTKPTLFWSPEDGSER